MEGGVEGLKEGAVIKYKVVWERASEGSWTDIPASLFMHVFGCETGRLLLSTVSLPRNAIGLSMTNY